MQSSTTSSGIKPLHWAVAGLGLVVFVLLLFADKTNLDNDRGRELRKETAPMASTENKSGKDWFELIAPIPPSPVWDSLRLEIGKAAKGPDRDLALQNAVNHLRNEGRIDAAALYAGQLADQSPTVKNLLVAGALFRATVTLPEIAGDTAVFGRFSRRGLGYLAQASQMEPENEDVLIELGLSYIGSGQPENSMQGIQQLLKVLELNPNNSEAAFHLGMFSRQTGQWEKAADRFETVLRVDPQNEIAKYNLALTYLDMNSPEKAKALLRELSENATETGLAEAARELMEKI